MFRNKMSGTIMLIFIFGMDRAKLFFLAAKVPNFFFGSQNHFYFWQLTHGVRMDPKVLRRVSFN